MVRLINYRNIQADTENQTIFLKEKGMRIGFGGIAKGYAADRAKQLLISLCNLWHCECSRDLTTWVSEAMQSLSIGIAALMRLSIHFHLLISPTCHCHFWRL
jgi:thiamine biosynthesis lipoprotein